MAIDEETLARAWQAVEAYEASENKRRSPSAARQGRGSAALRNMVGTAKGLAGFPFTGVKSLVQARESAKRLNPKGALATGLNEALFGLPARLNKNLENTTREYEEQYPLGSKVAKGAGFLASMAPFGGLNAGIRAAGRGLASAAKSGSAASHLSRMIGRSPLMQAVLENAAASTVLDTPELIDAGKRGVGDLVGQGITSAAKGAIGGAVANRLALAGGGLWRKFAGRTPRTLPSEYRMLESHVGKDTINKSIAENKPLVRLIDVDNNKFFRRRAIQTPENIMRFRELREASNLNMPETFREEVIKPFFGRDNVDERVARLTALGRRRAAPWYEKSKSIKIENPNFLKELAASRPILKAASKYRMNAPEYSGLKSNEFNVGLLNDAKKELDNQYSSNLNRGFSNENLSIIDPARRRILDIIDSTTPLNKYGRKRAENYLKHQEQGNRGKDFLNQSEYSKWQNFDEKRPLAGISAGQKKTFLSGVGSSLYKDALAEASPDRQLRTLSDLLRSQTQRKIGSLLAEKKAANFYGKVNDLVKEQRNFNWISPKSAGIKSSENPKSFGALARTVSRPMRALGYMFDTAANPPMPKEYVDVLSSPSTLERLRREAKIGFDSMKAGSDALKNLAYRFGPLKLRRDED
jgi:hypothetical protein